jgi:thiosulfate/3-mercaptopyruvate sulfurtransferase
MRPGQFRRAAALAALAIFLAAHTHIHAQGPSATPSAGSALSVPAAQLIQPAELSQILSAHSADKPLVLQVGSHVLFAEAHSAGSEYAGAGSQAAGLKQLQNRVAPLLRETLIVLYCGCCPWNRCPNIEPAFKLLSHLGFTHVRVLYVASNLGTDWVDKGYPVERGR